MQYLLSQRFMRIPYCLLRFLLLRVILSLSRAQLLASPGIDTLVRVFQHMSANEGLSQGFVKCIYRDKKGFMWFCTKDGINRYDGRQIKKYQQDVRDPYSLQDNHVLSVFEDENNNFWVCTATEGIFLFDRIQERFYRTRMPRQGIPSMDRSASTAYLDGRLIIGGANPCIYDVSGIRPPYKQGILLPELFSYREQIAQNDSDLTHDKNLKFGYFQSRDTIWFVNARHLELCIWDSSQKNWAITKISPARLGLSEKNELTSLSNYSVQGKQVFSDGTCLVMYNTARRAVESRFEWPLTGTIITSIYSYASGNLLLSTNFGPYVYNPNGQQLSALCGNFEKNGIVSVCSDNHTLWLGYTGAGIYKCQLEDDLFQNIGHPLPQFYIRPFGFVVADVQVINTKIKDVRSVVQKYIRQWPSYGLIRSLIEGKYPGNSSSAIWFVAVVNKTSFLCRLVAKSDQLDLFKWPYHSPPVHTCLFRSNSGDFWYSDHNSAGSVAMKLLIPCGSGQKENMHVFPVANERGEYQFISDAWQDKNGTFWFGTTKGLYSFDEKSDRWNKYTHIDNDSSSLSVDMIFSIYPDPTLPEKYLWVGTNGGGLERFEYSSGKFMHFGIKDGLPNEVIYGILSDKQNKLWLSSNSGLTCFSYNGTVNVTNMNVPFSGEPSVSCKEFNRYEYLNIDDDKLAFGGLAGITVFQPSQVRKATAAPKVVLTGFKLFDKEINIHTDTSILNRNITYASTITLPYSKNFFSIDFAALDFDLSSNVTYKYQLEGFDKVWVNSGNGNTAAYTNVPHGRYTFNVTASVNGGEWTHNGARIEIIVLAPWWATWWFRCSTIILTIGLIYSLYRYKIRQLLKIQSLRNNIAADLHDEIGSTLSSIAISSSIIKKKINKNPAEVETLLTQISDTTEDMMQAMSDIVWSINSSNDRFDSLTARMLEFAILILEPKNSVVDFSVDKTMEDIKLNMIQRKNIYLIFKEAINNAAKYAECTKVVIRFSMAANKKLEMSISDNGKGFATSGSAGMGSNLNGNGLRNMYSRASELVGSVNIVSDYGSGTKVILIFPL